MHSKYIQTYCNKTLHITSIPVGTLTTDCPTLDMKRHTADVVDTIRGNFCNQPRKGNDASANPTQPPGHMPESEHNTNTPSLHSRLSCHVWDKPEPYMGLAQSLFGK